MSLPIQIDDRCPCCEEDYLVLCNGCGKFLDTTKFATYRIGEQTGYSEQGGAYCKSCSEECKRVGTTSQSVLLTIEAFVFAV